MIIYGLGALFSPLGGMVVGPSECDTCVSVFPKPQTLMNREQ